MASTEGVPGYIADFCHVLFVLFSDNTIRTLALRSQSSVRQADDITLEAILSIAALVIPAISSLIVAFIKIPEIIAQYLFNAEEDKNMTTIIKNIQDYDKIMFEMEQKINQLLSSHKDQSVEVEDDSIEESPTEHVS